ncbi:MAG: TolC family protein [Campylobacterota bacterium]|nr:TolC family protein [Campylobacterota bacterium]
MKLLLFIIPVFIYGQSLQSLIVLAKQKSDLVVSKELSKKAKNISVEARKSSYYPTIDMGAAYQTLNEKTYMMPGDIYSGYAKAGIDIYDGGKKSALLEQSRHEYDSSGFDLEAQKQSLSLEISKAFFNIKSMRAVLDSREEAKRSLQEQLTRMQRFYKARVATKDDVDRLQAAFDTNTYEMESLKLQILSLKYSLELYVGKEITSLDDSKFTTFKEHEIELTDSIKSHMAGKDALVSRAESIDSSYYPTIRLEDTYSMYDYGRTDSLHPEGVDAQNKLLVSLNFRLYDNGVISKTKQALMIDSQAAEAQIAFSTKEQQMQYDIAVATIKTSASKIKSAKSALTSATSAFTTISKKYEAGIVDNVAYLDALSSQTSAKALYETSLNDLEVAYATYYYYAGKNIEEFLQ